MELTMAVVFIFQILLAVMQLFAALRFNMAQVHGLFHMQEVVSCIKYSTIAIDHCIIQDNHCMIGGGISCFLSNVHLSGSVVKNNTALMQAGGIIISNDCEFIFDSIQKNSVYLNYGPKGCDISKTISLNDQHIVLDTATVLFPDNYFYYSHDNYGNPLNNMTWEVDHGKIEQTNADYM